MEAAERKMLELMQEAFWFHCKYYSASKCAKKLRDRGFENVSAGFIEAFYKQLAKIRDRLRANAEKLHYYDIILQFGERGGPYNSVIVWSDRYILLYEIYSKSDPYSVKVIDCLNDKSTLIKLEKSEEVLNLIVPLDQGFGLSVESNEYTSNHRHSFVSLIYLDFASKTFEKLDTIDIPDDDVSVLVNKFEPTEFALRYWADGNNCTQLYKIDRTSIVIGDLIELNDMYDTYNLCYYDGCIYGISSNRGHTMYVYNVAQKSTETFYISEPKGYEFYDGNYLHYYEILDGRLFVSLECKHVGEVIASVDWRTEQWTIFEIVPKNYIYNLDFVNGTNLIVTGGNNEEVKVEGESGPETVYSDYYEFYKFPIRKPDFLRNMAWITLVKLMKKIDTVKDPYEAARRYLPYNSDIRCPFVVPDPNEKKGPPVKRIKSE